MSSLFILSGLFLGWSLGANDAANIFGTGVRTKMFTFRKAAIISSIFVILGAIIGGRGTSFTIVRLGSINTIGGAFTVALCAGIVVTIMTKTGLPVSTTQAIIGGIIGWNLYTGSFINTGSLRNIILSWFFSPLLTGIFSFIFFKVLRRILKKLQIHLLMIDNILREGLILTAIFGAYTLGANNIANVIGIFIPNFPISELTIVNLIRIKGYQILLFIGGFSISLGIITFSKKVIDTVGAEIFKLSPLSAFVVVFSESIVLFMFSSQKLEKVLTFFHLPKVPLVPVSSSHCVVGGVLGIGFAKGIRGINYKAISKILFGWITSPLLTMLITFILLFFMQNVFKIEVYKPSLYKINKEYIKSLNREKIRTEIIIDIVDKPFNNELQLYIELKRRGIERSKIRNIVEGAKMESLYIDSKKLDKFILKEDLTEKEIKFLRGIKGKTYFYRWEILESLKDIWKEEDYSKIEDFINYFKKSI